jgi:hypothetical protein
MPIKHTEVMKMKHVKALKTTQVILLLVVITFLSGIPGMVFGEEAFSVEYEEMIVALGSEESGSIISGDIIGISQDTCIPGPLLCIGCYEYICIGLYGYATMSSEACYLFAFCLAGSDCQALCIGLFPEIPPFR